MKEETVMHTRGPWHVGIGAKVNDDEGLPTGCLTVFADPEHRQAGVVGSAAVICVVAPPHRITEEDIANAALIADGPIMLDLLRDLCRNAHPKWGRAELGRKAIAEAKALLAKHGKNGDAL